MMMMTWHLCLIWVDAAAVSCSPMGLKALIFCMCCAQATAPTSLTGTGESLKSIKDKDGKDAPSTLQTIGDHSAGYLLKRSPKNGEWNKYWFVLNAKTNRVCLGNLLWALLL
jgi:hypothetical protein